MVGSTALRRCEPLHVAVPTRNSACFSPTRRLPSRPAIDRVAFACPSVTVRGNDDFKGSELLIRRVGRAFECSFQGVRVIDRRFNNSDPLKSLKSQDPDGSPHHPSHR